MDHLVLVTAMQHNCTILQHIRQIRKHILACGFFLINPCSLYRRSSPLLQKLEAL